MTDSRVALGLDRLPWLPDEPARTRKPTGYLLGWAAGVCGHEGVGGVDRDEMLRNLIDLQYSRNDIDFKRGTFRVRGDVIDIFPAENSEVFPTESMAVAVTREKCHAPAPQRGGDAIAHFGHAEVALTRGLLGQHLRQQRHALDVASGPAQIWHRDHVDAGLGRERLASLDRAGGLEHLRLVGGAEPVGLAERLLDAAARAADPRISGIESAEYVDVMAEGAIVSTTGPRRVAGFADRASFGSVRRFGGRLPLAYLVAAAETSRRTKNSGPPGSATASLYASRPSFETPSKLFALVPAVSMLLSVYGPTRFWVVYLMTIAAIGIVQELRAANRTPEPFEKVEEEMRRRAQQRSFEEEVAKWMKELREKARIVVKDKSTDKVVGEVDARMRILYEDGWARYEQNQILRSTSGASSSRARGWKSCAMSTITSRFSAA